MESPSSVSQGPWKTGLLYSGVFVGGIAVCFVLGTYALLAREPHLSLVVLAFSATLLVYQAERFVCGAAEDTVNQPERIAWARQHRGYVIGSAVVALVVAVLMLPWMQPEVLGVGMLLAALSGAYMLPVLPGKKRLKAVGFFKPCAIALGWSAGGVLLPLLQAQQAFTFPVLVLLGYRFFFVLPNALVSDWPDRFGDQTAGLRTPATEFSKKTVRRWALGSLALSGGLGAGLFTLGAVSPRLLLVDAVGLLVLALLVVGPWFKRWYFGLLLDGVIAWPLLTALLA